MTGDGVNDATALRAADIGIYDGSPRHDVARESAALVITADDFTSIVGGIRQGRGIFDNLRKAMSYAAYSSASLGTTRTDAHGSRAPPTLSQATREETARRPARDTRWPSPSTPFNAAYSTTPCRRKTHRPPQFLAVEVGVNAAYPCSSHAGDARPRW